ncbi:glycosyltransferase family 10 domain-containing protein [Planctomicrobium sp. SH664]|uniref:glycosyltransferase family 10 domain-containing protein n=1 Tax=Planctomicrobium sp. SH664 TaxID=3448125 RepID=UPI003F5B8778
MIRVKFSAKPHRDGFLRQLPGRQPIWGQCEFLFDPEERDYDWFVAYDDLRPLDNERFSQRAEELACPARNTILITVEPSSIKAYGHDFLNQFGLILTSHEPWSIPHRQALYTQPPLRWFYGAAESRYIDYDTMLRCPPLKKMQMISTVCSSKRGTHTLHTARYDFTQALKRALPELEVFGHGVRPIDDKAEALDDFRYHVAIENHVADHHCTEKLADSFLGATLPFYHGAANAADYFPAESLIPIDIGEPRIAIEQIRDAVLGGEYERRLDAILEARRRVLNEYNLFAVLSREIEQRHAAVSPQEQTQPAFLYSRHQMRNLSLGHSLRFFVDLAKSRGRRWLSRRAA